MFVSDLKKEFHDVVLHQRVLVLVSFNVDALCACKIIQALFQCDHIPYSIVPVQGQEDMLRAFAEHKEQIKYVLMVNCGASQDVVELLEADDDTVFFIVDSHRPVHVYNIYSESQVRLLMKPDDNDEVPAFQDIFREESDDEEEESNSEEDGEEPSGKRRRFDEAALERRRERRVWEQERGRILYEYTQSTCRGASAAITVFQLAWRMSKDTSDMLWWAIVGVTELYVRCLSEPQSYLTAAAMLQSHVSRHNHRNEDEENRMSVTCRKIAYDTELNLVLYRHWSLFESMRHSRFVSCAFKVWTNKGVKRLMEFLADMGMPLVQVKQKFGSMDVQFKSHVKDWIEDRAEKYHLQRIVFGSFHTQYGYRNKYCASDVVYAVTALLEASGKDKTASDRFLEALDCLSRVNVSLLERGVEAAKLLMQAILSTVHGFIDMHQLISAGPFLYGFIQQGTPDAKLFSRPVCLQMLARFMLHAYVVTTRNKRLKSLPLVLTAPLDEEEGTSIVVGMPPHSEESQKNLFGKAFEQAAEKTNSRISQDFFDSSVIKMKTEDRSKFFDALISLMA